MEPQKIEKNEKGFFVLEAWRKVLVRTLSIYWVTSVVFLFLRAFLKGLGANPDTIVVGFIYTVSGFFLLPYWGIFPQFRDTAAAGQASFDFAALIAIFCNTILILLAIIIVWVGANILKTGKQVEETVIKDNPVSPTTITQEVK
jgi:hypothetical protein